MSKTPTRPVSDRRMLWPTPQEEACNVQDNHLGDGQVGDRGSCPALREGSGRRCRRSADRRSRRGAARRPRGRSSGALRIDDVEAKIEAQVEQLQADGLEADFRLVSGSAPHPAHMIFSDVAAEVGADLIIIGARGHTAVAGLLLGSVTQRLLHIAPCPVLRRARELRGRTRRRRRPRPSQRRRADRPRRSPGATVHLRPRRPATVSTAARRSRYR